MAAVFIIEDLKGQDSDFHGLTGEIPYGLKAGIRSVVTIHDLILCGIPGFIPFDRNIHRLKASYAVKNADIVVAVSQQTKDDIIATLTSIPKNQSHLSGMSRCI